MLSYANFFLVKVSWACDMGRLWASIGHVLVLVVVVVTVNC